MKQKQTPPEELLAKKKECEQEIADLEKKEAELILKRDSTISVIGARHRIQSALAPVI